MMLDSILQAAIQQMGLAAIYWCSVSAFVAATLLSVSWMAAGLLSKAREF